MYDFINFYNFQLVFLHANFVAISPRSLTNSPMTEGGGSEGRGGFFEETIAPHTPLVSS
jgi:hypothetical protein